MLSFTYDVEKAIQSAAIVCKFRGKGNADFGSITKLLYLADRKSIAERGFPITGDSMYSLPHGPVLSAILDSLRCPVGKWADFFKRSNGYEVEAVEDPGTDKLSKKDLRIINSILESYGHNDFVSLRRITHNGREFPEYHEIDDGREPIDPEDILHSVNVSETDIEEIRKDAQYVRAQSLISINEN